MRKHENTEHTSVRHPPHEELVDHKRFKKYQSLCARANFLAIDPCDAIWSEGMLQIDVNTDSARQTEANGKILDWLSESCYTSTSSRTSMRC